MQNSLVKAKHFCSEHKGAVLMLGMLVCVSSIAIASNSNAGTGTNDAAFKTGYDWLNSVIHGNLGTLFAAVAFIIGLVVGITKQSPGAVIGGVIFALLIAFGPDMATGIVNSSLIGNPVQKSMSVFELCFVGGFIALGLNTLKNNVRQNLNQYAQI
jgi:conjugal transfer pilus assembly protein TraA